MPRRSRSANPTPTTKWCEQNKETLHFNVAIEQKMEVNFAGETFHLVNRLTGEDVEIVVFVAVLPHSQYVYTGGEVSPGSRSGLKLIAPRSAVFRRRSRLGRLR